MTQYDFTWKISAPGSSYNYTRAYSSDYDHDAEGHLKSKKMESTVTIESLVSSANAQDPSEKVKYSWSDMNPGGTMEQWIDGQGTTTTTPIPTYYSIYNRPPPDYTLDHLIHDTSGFPPLQVRVVHSFANGVKHDWPNYDGSTTTVTAEANTQEKLFTGGKAQVRRKNLFCLTVSATEYFKPELPPWFFTPSKPVHGARNEILGKKAGDDDRVYIVLPDNAALATGQKVTGAKHVSFGAGATKHILYITANGVRLDPSEIKTTNCVGQKIIFAHGFDPAGPDGVASSSYEWLVSSKNVNTNWYRQKFVSSGDPYDPGLWLPYGSAIYANKQEHWNVESPHAWWISGGIKNARLNLSLTFNNGQTVKLDAKGKFQIYKPEIIFTPTPPFMPQVSNRGGTLWLQLGDEAGNNIMSWDITLKQYPRVFPGYVFHTQLISRDAQVGHGLWGVENISTGGSYWLDNQEDYINGNGNVLSTSHARKVTFGDSPGFDCGTASRFIDVVDNFRAYFRFKPDPQADSIPVTMGIITWGWSARADEINGNWSATRTNVTPPSFSPSDDFPEWDFVYPDDL